MLKTRDQRLVIATGLVLILGAFIQCWRMSHDLYWFYDLDVARDMSYVQQTLYGHFGKDPNYPGEYLWYNPLMSLLQAGVIKISGLPINVVMVRLGAYFNVLAPLSFFTMMLVMLDLRTALGGLLSYLFLATGSIYAFYAATYSPWMYSGLFMQFIFYINITLCYLAFNTQKTGWFLALGSCVGISFLGHTAPTVLIILILISLQGKVLWQAIKNKEVATIKKVIAQSLFVFIPFLIFSFPLLYYILGKYHMHFLNRKPFEYLDTIFIWRNYKDMIRLNLSLSFVISVVGFIWFYRKFRQPLVRSILLNWFWLAGFMFVYSSIVTSLDQNKEIHLPGTVPSFHYFFYLKALQSVFYGFGLVFIAGPVLEWVLSKINPGSSRKTPAIIPFAAMVLVCAIVYFPAYAKRTDFVYFRDICLNTAKDQGKIDVYYYIRDNIPQDEVFLSEEHTSLFPLMATARKMVSNGLTFSNPYVDFGTREHARNSMLAYLRDGQASDAPDLFKKYHVSYILLTNSNLKDFKNLALVPSTVVFQNSEYTILHINAPK
jgi:hypothetical protein